MVMGKYSRVDGRRSSRYCSTVTVVVFVALCLAGLWLWMPSSVGRFQNSELKTSQTMDQIKQRITDRSSTQFEDSSGNLPEGDTREDGNTEKSEVENKSDVFENKENSTYAFKNIPEEHFEDRTAGENSNERVELENEFKREAENGDSKMVDIGLNPQHNDSNLETDGKQEVRNGDTATNALEKSDESLDENKSDSEYVARKPDMAEGLDHNNQQGQVDIHTEENRVEENQAKHDAQNTGDGSTKTTAKNQDSNEVLQNGDQSEILNETSTQSGAWSTQATESENEKKYQQSMLYSNQNGYDWKFCNVSAGPDYIPCLDNLQAVKKLRSTKHFEHRERHCPVEAPTCLVPLPKNYKRPLKWPQSREKIWYYNAPHTKLVEVKGYQNWVKFSGEYLKFPGGGTQFVHGALHYIDFIEESLPEIAWGKKSRVILDVGCGVASFGGYLFDRDVLAMSFAPKDEHEAQVQFALERGIPAISAVMGTARLPFPSMVFDVVHCARCRVRWHIDGGKLLLELNRVLRPGGYFVWSATPVYKKLPEDAAIWKAMSLLTKSICWDLKVIKKDRLNGVGAAIFKKPTSNVCYDSRSRNDPPLCEKTDDPNAAWNVSLDACVHRVPEDGLKRGGQWPEKWPARLEKPPSWLRNSEIGVYGRAAPEDFSRDYGHWKRVVSSSYLKGFGIDWSSVRNVMDMRAVYGGFAAALSGLKVWVMNVVPIDSPDTLPIIYERGLFGVYHDWCESFSTYPRSYDLLHADHLFSSLKNRCKLRAVMAEVDRILRPEGKLIVRDDVKTVSEIEEICRSLHWEIELTYSKQNQGLLRIHKTLWRPALPQTLLYAIA